ncbi:MAG: hypothetical protein BHW56_04610 [Acetobacter sp. 46_36]|nr:MAG: hypothetical protein BHW56_04610 [Acetobacter sp. 46_36]
MYGRGVKPLPDLRGFDEMNKNAEILIAAAEDAKDIARLSYQVGKMHDEALPDYFKPTTEEEHLVIVRKMMADDNMFLLKAVYDGKICGFICLFIQGTPRNGYVHSKIGYIYNFGVDEMCRGQGVGSLLLKKAEVFLRDRGVEAIELSVFCFNRRAIGFYERNGYQALEVNLQKVLK